MNLQEFVKISLTQLIDGVQDAREEIASQGSTVPPVYSMEGGLPRVYRGDSYGYNVQIIEFDVAVTAQENDSLKGGMGIFVGPFAVGTQGQSGGQNATVNRVKFSVPVTLPTQPIPKKPRPKSNAE